MRPIFRSLSVSAVFLASGLASGLAVAAPSPKTKPSLSDQVQIPYQKFVLDNGLTLIVHEDHKAPIVAVNVWYHVGAKDEAPGKSGFAHLFEHLMFNGSEHFNTDYFKALGAIGATDLNGTTNRDRTNYFQNVPTSGLDQVLFLESDRMGHLVGVIDKARLDEQRGVVQNEKRQGENQPYGQVFNEANKVLFPSHHPYAFPRGTVIGSMEDLDGASLKDVHEWFKTYYGPNNATLVLAGDIDAKTALEKVKKYFGHIPAGPPLVQLGPWVEKLPANVHRVMEDRVPQARLYRFWVTPAVTSPDADYLNLAAEVLGTGKSSRLFQRLVYQDQLATDVSVGVWDGEIAGQFIIQATAKPGVELGKIERVVDEELARFLKTGPTPAELERLRTRTVGDFIRQVERIGGFGGKSDVLASSQVYKHSPDAWRDELKRLETATPADVLRVSREWLGAPRLDFEVHPFGKLSASASDVDRKKLPELGQAPAIHFPALERRKLKNCLEVVLARRPGNPTLSLALHVPVGTAADGKQKAGLAALTMNLLDEGTKTKNAIQLSEKLDSLAAQLRTGTELDESTVTLSALEPNLEPSLELFAEVLRAPAFSESDVKRIREAQLAGIQQERSRPEAMARRLASRLFFGDGHPYALPSSGRGFTATVEKLTRDDVLKWYESALKPAGSYLSVVGDITMDELVAKLEKALAGWTGKAPQRSPVPQVALADKPVVYLVDRPGSLQTVVLAGHPVVGTNNPDETAIEGFNEILGGDFLSRLNMNLREDKHWSYGVRSLIPDALGQRLFGVFAPVQTDKTKESLAEIKKELSEIVNARPPTVEEFTRTQADRVLRLPGRWETLNAIQGSLGYLLTYGLPDSYFQTYADQVRKLTREQITQAAGKLLKPNSLVWVIVGDRAKIEKGVRDLKLGELHFADADGNPVQ